MIELNLPLAVIALPAIAPLIALIQLLFPGLLGDHWKQYRAAIVVLTTQSTLMFAQWLPTFWMPPDSSWWLGPQALAWGMAIVAVVGFFASLVIRPVASDAAPARIEFLALQGLLLASLAWLAWQWFSGASLFDQMLVIALGCGGGLLHLLLRRTWAAANRRATFATESVFLLLVASSGVAIAQFVFANNASQGQLANVAGDSTTFRSNSQRTGSRHPTERGPQRPKILGLPYQPKLLGGAVHLESSPVVSPGALILGVRHQIQASAAGVLFGVPLESDGRISTADPWSFGDQTTRGIFSTPAVHHGYVYFGEGYHQHQRCRLFCLDAQNGELAWWFRTTSHVESPPTIVGERIFFGAGDDGIYCLNLPKQKGGSPTVAWHYDSIHVDSSPLVVEGRVFVGGVVGDVVANLKCVALDATTGQKLWEKPSEFPFAASLAYDDGAVFVGLGNGKLNAEASNPRGSVWRLAAADGARQWEFPLDSSVLTSPIPAEGRVHFVARNGDCYGLDAATGERLWKYQVGEAVVSSPIVSGGQMFVVSLHGSLVCLDAKTGGEVWRFDELRQTTASVFSSPTLFEGRLYVAMGGEVHCVGDADQL